MTSKREAFRKYLESGNVIESLNRAMISLNEQETKPEDPLLFIRELLNANNEGFVNVDDLLRKNQDLNAKVVQLRHELALLKAE